ncbi:MAG: PQQ-binding-like beta-propeller repeat protein [Alphaproteobacteria bacterium]|nr:PQQ-binding-like beta-propeller repeat protein [Alphaproteobacteria bacterium]
MKSRAIGTMLALVVLGLPATLGQTRSGPTEWRDWGGDAARTHFSPLQQINASNVFRLKPVWVWDGGTFGRSWEITPLLVDGLLYVSESGSSDVVALAPETGKEIWRHKAPNIPGRGVDRRGFAYWAGDGTMKPRIIVLWGHLMFGLDLKTGELSADWPSGGLDIGLPNPANGGAIGGGVFAASPPIIYKNLIITTAASGFQPSPAQPADPHANDLRNGKLVWTARLIPGAGEPGSDTWGPEPQNIAGSGSWGILALDEQSGTVYVPTDSGSPDYSGIWRPGDNANADATVALDAQTGRIKWSFQNHHHDIFDLDTNAAPSPVEITRNGRRMKVIVQTTKQGMLWILDAQTGKPIFPYEERPVKQSAIPGEKSSPTQPFTILPPVLSAATVRRENLSRLSDRANAECKALYDANKLEDATPFNPPRPDGAWTIMPIGAIGGVDWGGASIDLDRGYAVMNLVNLPTMITVTKSAQGIRGNDGYRSTSGNVRFADNDGRSCNGGRQGELAAVNLATGRVVWQVPLGSLEDAYGARAKDLGATSIGPTLATRGGVVFAAATDDRLHAYDTLSGRLLWQMKMAASANAGPMTYMGKDGRQYVVVAAGGPGNARRPSPRETGVFHQTLVAFALPRATDKPLDIITPYPKRELRPGESLAMDSSGGARLVPAPANP